MGRRAGVLWVLIGGSVVLYSFLATVRGLTLAGSAPTDARIVLVLAAFFVGLYLVVYGAKQYLGVGARL